MTNVQFPLMIGRLREAAVVVSLILLSACASTPGEKPKINVFYERDLEVCVNGECFVGTGVPKPSVRYEIEVKARGDNDFLLFESCHLWKKFENEGKNVKFTYVPVDELENNGECPMYITSLNSSNKKSAWAFVAFPDIKKKYNLSAYLRCNGFEGQSEIGVSVCQSAFDLVQQINFPREVFSAQEGECVMTSPDAKKFEYKMKKGECVYKFKERGQDKWHILYTLGIEQSLFRGD